MSKKTTKQVVKSLGHSYELTEKGKKDFPTFTKQNAVVMGLIKKAGRLTIAQILATPNIKGLLNTTQEPRRPVAWLLAEARTVHGWIKFSAKSSVKAPKAKKSSAKATVVAPAPASLAVAA